ncbi:response regulator [Pleurocapsales cyanobacterium LEGE 10410]|nr:response regulator [Pleurocapsales cyanobacterium LEGE 10410]
MNAIKSQLEQIRLHFQNAVNLKQSCKIYVATAGGDSWGFYFKQGQLIWGTSSVHRFRRLYRITNQICPGINCQKVRLREQEISELWEYLFIGVLYKRKQIGKLQAESIVQEIIKEVLFDCLMANNQISQIKVIFETKANSMGAILKSPLFKQPITQAEAEKTINQLESLVSNWKTIEIVNCTPNLAPVIKDIDRLKKTVSPETYLQLYAHINGKKTLRDLAVVSQQDLLKLTRSLVPHIKSKAIALQEIPDRQLENLYFSPGTKNNQYSNSNKDREYIQELDLPLIIYVDDNPHDSQQITQILNPAGYRIIPVNDAAKTLMVLLENQPNLIFLNAAMPDVNGYELCAQIRKMPGSESVPIIILREQENIIDRVRAKMAGVSDFANKPINPAEILTLAQKYTQSFIEQKI